MGTRWPKHLWLAVLVAAMTVSACGEEDSVLNETTERPEAAAPSTTEPEPAAPVSSSAGRPDLDNFLSDLRAAAACDSADVGPSGTGAVWEGDERCVGVAASLLHENGLTDKSSAFGTYDTIEAALLDATESGSTVLYRSESIFGIAVKVLEGGYEKRSNGFSIQLIDGAPARVEMYIDTMANIEELRSN